jgi:very-short-patch-repair endonuclease
MRQESDRPLEWKLNFEFVKGLRQHMTIAEQILWKVLRDRRCGGLKFRRQVRMESFVADFLCKEHHLVVEVDGGIHRKRKSYDRERDAFLRACGYRVLRITNREIKADLPLVLARIRRSAKQHTYTAPLSPQGEGKGVRSVTSTPS